MPSLKEVRIRIASVDSTKQITSAMKMVSASKLRRAQERILNLRPFHKELTSIVNQVINDIPFQINSPFFENRQGGRCLVIVMSSNRGLCGVFNANVNKFISSLGDYPQFKDFVDRDAVDYIVIGKKVGEFLKKIKANVIERHDDLLDKSSSAEVFKISEGILEGFIENKWNQVHVIYNQFKNPVYQQVVSDKVLPMQIPEIEPEYFFPEIEYIYQPDVPSIVDTLLSDFLKACIFKALLESSAGEHGARMTAMHKATDNATDLLKELKLTYNKARQAAITKEIIEIVSGANALE